jgi:uncharacterized protein YkwD
MVKVAHFLVVGIIVGAFVGGAAIGMKYIKNDGGGDVVGTSTPQATATEPAENPTDVAQEGASVTTADAAKPSVQTTAAPTTTHPGELNNQRLERLIAKHVNRERREVGLYAYEYDDDLAEIAQYHSNDMVNESYLGHVSRDGETVNARFRKFDYHCARDMPSSPFGMGGELVQRAPYNEQVRIDGDLTRFDTLDDLARGVVEMWMHDSDERDRLTSETWQNHGIGASVGYQNGQLTVWVTHNLC